MPASAGDPATLTELFWEAVSANAERPAQEWYEDGAWRSRTYGEFGRAVRDLANALLADGAKKGDRVAIWGKNSPRWAEADFAILSAGLVSVPIYDTLTAEKAAYILQDAGARAVLVGDRHLLERLQSVRKDTKTVKTVVLLNGQPADGAVSYDEFLAKGHAFAETQPRALDEAAAAITPNDLASLVYTSGTTGEPKGAMLTHGNFTSNTSVKKLVGVGPDDVYLSFLPLSHVFERLGGHFGAYRYGAKVVFARSLESLLDDIQHARPTIMMAVPRLYEKMYARIQETVRSSSWLRRTLFEWAVRVGQEANVYRVQGRELPKELARKHARAQRLVLHKIQERVGGRLRYFVSGGAALSKEIETFFWACGVPILQGYGLTETSPVCAVNLPGAMRFGSVGRVIPGVQCRIDTDAWSDVAKQFPEGEICFKGPNVFQGYWKNKEATKEAFDRDGWFRTGDIGYLDADGFLFITDRKKEIIVMSNGKKVAPQPIENELKMQPHIAQAAVLGEQRNYIAALIVPDWEQLEKFAQQNGIAVQDRERLCADPRVVSLIEGEVEAVNRRLSRFEQVKKFWIVPRDWTVDSGELTPSLKLKRRVIHEKWGDLISKLYPMLAEAR
ncbi:MAG TPA: long-chain fatty acid--CoA ligase [Candidatus Thermoplasmatota archaeon]|nr:long-chain fatty acid--CoA ligase [Candidatus Thermoplasmatota archaeon]